MCPRPLAQLWAFASFSGVAITLGAQAAGPTHPQPPNPWMRCLGSKPGQPRDSYSGAARLQPQEGSQQGAQQLIALQRLSSGQTVSAAAEPS